MKVVVIGQTGQLARALVEVASTTGVDLVTLGRPRLDLVDTASVVAGLRDLSADVVVNAAAYTAVDHAEGDEVTARAVNAAGAEHIAQACAEGGIPVIHVSTDYVFDGSKSAPYLETDAPSPLNAYGRSKLEGEQRVAIACREHIIVRTAWLHSPFGRNFVTSMLRHALERPEIGVVADQIGSPTYAPHLATAILDIARHVVRDREGAPWGVYHVANTGEASWRDVAVAIFAASRELGGPTSVVRAISSAEYPVAARRPANSRLDTSKLARVFGVQLPDWRSGISACVARLLADAPKTASSSAPPAATT